MSTDVGSGLSDEGRRSKPRLTIPALSVLANDDYSDSDQDSTSSSSGDEEDVMTAEEEAAARRYLSGASAPTDQRRMSSLDTYLLQPKVEAEPMLINRRLSLRHEEEEIAQINTEDTERKKEEEHKEKLRREREEVKRAREQKLEDKSKNGTEKCPSPRRATMARHGFGGLGREKRNKLKELIMQKAREQLKAEQMKEMEKRNEYLRNKMPPLKLDGLDEKQLIELITQWHNRLKEIEAEKFEIEKQMMEQEYKMHELTLQSVEMKGKYAKPILRKVRKSQSLIVKLEKMREVSKTKPPMPNLREVPESSVSRNTTGEKGQESK